MKIAILKARLAREEYEALRAQADAAGLTISEQVRVILSRDRQEIGVETVLTRVQAMLPARAAHPDPLLVEMLWLLRELAGERSPQALIKIGAKMDAAFGRERSRI